MSRDHGLFGGGLWIIIILIIVLFFLGGLGPLERDAGAEN